MFLVCLEITCGTHLQGSRKLHQCSAFLSENKNTKAIHYLFCQQTAWKRFLCTFNISLLNTVYEWLQEDILGYPKIFIQSTIIVHVHVPCSYMYLNIIVVCLVFDSDKCHRRKYSLLNIQNISVDCFQQTLSLPLDWSLFSHLDQSYWPPKLLYRVKYTHN